MKKILVISFALLLTISGYSQHSEIGLFGGVSYYLGDLNPSSQFSLPHPAAAIFYRYNFNPRFAYKLFFGYGTVEGNDAVVKFDEERNLSFKSVITELSNQIELNFIKYVPGNLDYGFTPYIFVGFTIFYFDPKAEYNGHWYALQPLGTEGQTTSEHPNSKKYSLVSTAIPFGAGIKLNLSKLITIGLEWGMRKTFTDYLDDVSTTYTDPKVLASENGPLSAILADRSLPVNGKQVTHTNLQRGNSKTKDWYSFAGFTLTYKIKNKVVLCPIYEQHFNYKEHKLYD